MRHMTEEWTNWLRRVRACVTSLAPSLAVASGTPSMALPSGLILVVFGPATTDSGGKPKKFPVAGALGPGRRGHRHPSAHSVAFFPEYGA